MDSTESQKRTEERQIPDWLPGFLLLMIGVNVVWALWSRQLFWGVLTLATLPFAWYLSHKEVHDD